MDMNIKEYQAEYYKNNKDKINKKRLETHKDNPNVRKQQQMKFYDDNSERLIERQTIYNKENAERIKIYQREYYAKNKDKINKKRDDYNNENVDKIKERKMERVVCECGCDVVKSTLKRHQKTQKHFELMELKKCVVIKKKNKVKRKFLIIIEK